jgi:hypothetical protein
LSNYFYLPNKFPLSLPTISVGPTNLCSYFFSQPLRSLSLLPLARALIDLYFDAGRTPPPCWYAPPLQYSLTGGAPPDASMVPPRPSPQKTARAGLPRRGGLGPQRWPCSLVQRPCSPAWRRPLRRQRLPRQRSLPGACYPPLPQHRRTALLRRAARGRPQHRREAAPPGERPCSGVVAYSPRRALCCSEKNIREDDTWDPHVMDC